jgi:ATP-dependent Lon protease
VKKTAKGKQESLTAVNRLVSEEIELEKRIAAFYDILCDIYGTERVILKANKLEALGLIRSDKLGERVLGLQKLVMEDPTLDQPPREQEIAGVLANLEMAVADVVAHRALEERLDRLIAERMQERHEEYFREVRDQILRESAGVENAQTLKKLAGHGCQQGKDMVIDFIMMD